MIFQKKLMFIAIIFAASLQVCFAETVVKAEVDKLSLTTDETLTYKVVVTSSETKLPMPQMPDFKGFNEISQANSSTISFAKGQIKTVLVYAYILSPNTTGKITIGPATIKVKDEVFSTQEFAIEVAQGNAPPQSPTGPKKTLPPDFPFASEEPQFTL
jgi:hypothetical protein